MDLRWEILAGYAPLFVSGVWMTIRLTLVAIGAGLVLGIAFGLVSTSADAPAPATAPMRWLLALARGVTLAYVTFFRGTPLFVQILLVHFALMPTLVHPETGMLLSGEAAARFRQDHGAFLSGALALTLNAGAYISEIFRAGIQSVPRGQLEAAQVLGIPHLTALRLVILPQAFRNMLPVLLTQTIILFQDTSLVYAIGAYDLLKGFEIAGKNFNRPVETYLVAAVVYFVICFSLSMLVRRLQARIAIIR